MKSLPWNWGGFCEFQGCLHAQEKEDSRAKGEDAGQDAPDGASQTDAEGRESCKQEEQDHEPDGNSLRQFHFNAPVVCNRVAAQIG